MSELFDAWYAIASVNWFPNTVRQNRSVLRRHLHPRFGQVKVGDLTPAMIEAVYADLQRHGSVLGGPLAAGTVARIHVMLRSSLSPRDALGLDLGQSRRTHLSDRGARPGDLTTQPGRGRSTPPPCPTARSRPPFVDHLGYGDGARRAQLLGLRWSACASPPDVCSSAGVGSKARRPMLAETKNKHRHNFDLDLDPDTCELLADHAQRAARRNGGALDPRADPFAHASGAGHDR